MMEQHPADVPIDLTLAVLNETQPDAAMEARILAALAQRATERAAAPARLWIWAVPLGAAAVAVLVGSALLHLAAPTPAAGIADAVSSQPALRIDARTIPIPRRLATPLRVHAGGVSRAATALSSTDALALDLLARDEMAAPSAPSPRQPLTSDERQLREALRRGEYVDLARATPAEAAPDVAAIFARIALAAMTTDSNPDTTSTPPAASTQEPEHDSQ